MRKRIKVKVKVWELSDSTRVEGLHKPCRILTREPIKPMNKKVLKKLESKKQLENLFNN